jgi:capsular exopolysaccharide synthesis family protein
VVDPAKLALVPLSPNLPLNFALGILGGLVCSALFVIVRTTTEARIQDPGNVEFHLNLPELGIIPSAALVPGLRRAVRLLPEAGDGSHSQAKATGSILVSPDGKRQLRESLALVTWTRRSSVMSEAFRAAMTSILFSTEKMERAKALVITSATSGEGKTTVTTNLAIALAEINRRVVVIDADMRIPRLHQIFDLPNALGLTDFLHDRRAIDEYADEELVNRTNIPNVFVMTAGPARSNLSRLLYSQRMSELLARLRGSFDAILLDSPPVMSVPDARILARAADGVVLVVRARQTYRASASAAVRRFERDGSPLLGTILTDWNPKKSAFGPYGPYTAYKAYGG